MLFLSPAVRVKAGHEGRGESGGGECKALPGPRDVLPVLKGREAREEAGYYAFACLCSVCRGAVEMWVANGGGKSFCAKNA